ncbi:hypothetical protein QYF61_021631, partial [Mycteria americana]
MRDKEKAGEDDRRIYFNGGIPMKLNEYAMRTSVVCHYSFEEREERGCFSLTRIDNTFPQLPYKTDLLNYSCVDMHKGQTRWCNSKTAGVEGLVHVFPVLRTPELDTVLQVGSHQSRAEGQNHLPRPAGHASFDAAQDAVGLLGCKHTLLSHVQLFIHQYPQALLFRAALSPFIPQPVLILGVALTQVQDPALGLVEPHEVHMGPLLELVQVPLDGILSLRHVNHTTQLGVVCKFAEGALDPTVCVIDEDINQYWSQHGPLRDTT